MQEQASILEKRGFSFERFDFRIALLAAINVVTTLTVYLPFIDRLDVIYRYLDGPLYMYVAKTLYAAPAITPFNLPGCYYACHLALYPLLIRAFSFMGYDRSMIFVVIACSTLATIVFYQLLKEFNYSANPFWASIVFIFFPSRWLLYHSVGASEPLFILLILASIYCYKKDRYLAAFTLAGLASVTKIFGVLMFISYLILLLYEKKYRYLPYLLIIPAFLGLNFLAYQFTYGDFFAYFRWNGGLMKIVPFMNFFEPASRGNTNNAELFMGFYIIYILGALRLWKRPELCSFSLVYLGCVAFVQHPDVSRYLLPAAPFALIIAFDDIISRREFKLIFPLLVIFGYFYCWGIIPTNVIGQDTYSALMEALAQ
ncbi:hypothetical protein Mtc_0340 [Methanocella conradii HZ254]|uniref:Glycosyltransferase RgtA/B/C/D-like domain-containing protein n=1 Tax=Methanocella conradii (strain DSM 24694 / JCM 17849 / CGMCC 1.5162 / HZ254) TaxID=1041930 RepID=H8IA44_METCZ|nr:hypothetical protein [Methanocella conradii]AFC99110.1 hypothetical protein Mtc_0340 [Methanocella conradii HZ254]